MLEIILLIGRKARYIDSDDQVYFSLTGGDEFSTDNTCRMFSEFDKCKKEIRAELTQRITDLTTLASITTCAIELGKIVSRIEKLNLQLSILNRIISGIGAQIILQKILSRPDTNLISVLLAPLNLDTYTRQHIYHMTLQRKQTSPDGDILRIKLKNMITPIMISDSKTTQQSRKFLIYNELIQQTIALSKHYQSQRLPFKAIDEVIQIAYRLLKQYLNYSDTAPDIAFIKDVNLLNGNETFEVIEICDLVINAFQIPPLYWFQNDGLFQTLCGNIAIYHNKPQKTFAEENGLKRALYEFYGMIQLALAATFSYLREQEFIDRSKNFDNNFNNPDFNLHLITAITTALNQGTPIIDAILDVIFSLNIFELRHQPSEAHIAEIISKFMRVAFTLYDAPHYDEFLFTEQKPGPVAVLDTRICVKLPDIVLATYPELYNEYYGANSTLEARPMCQDGKLHATATAALTIAISAKTIAQYCNDVTHNRSSIDKIINLFNFIPLEHFTQLMSESQIFIRTIIGNHEQLIWFLNQLEASHQNAFIEGCPKLFQIHAQSLDCCITLLKNTPHQSTMLNVLMSRIATLISSFEELNQFMQIIAPFIMPSLFLGLLIEHRGHLDGIITDFQQISSLATILSLENYIRLNQRLSLNSTPTLWSSHTQLMLEDYNHDQTLRLYS